MVFLQQSCICRQATIHKVNTPLLTLNLIRESVRKQIFVLAIHAKSISRRLAFVCEQDIRPHMCPLTSVFVNETNRDAKSNQWLLCGLTAQHSWHNTWFQSKSSSGWKVGELPCRYVITLFRVRETRYTKFGFVYNSSTICVCFKGVWFD